jgi:hypothetical protein
MLNENLHVMGEFLRALIPALLRGLVWAIIWGFALGCVIIFAPLWIAGFIAFGGVRHQRYGRRWK